MRFKKSSAALTKEKRVNPTNALVLIAGAFVLVGVVLGGTAGLSFVFFYRQHVWWALVLLLLAFVVAMFCKWAKNPFLVRRPTWWARWLLMYLLVGALGAGVVLFALMGWFAAITVMTGTNTKPTPGRLLSVGEHSKGKGCDQHGVLAVNERYETICLEGLLALPAQANMPVMVTGTLSPAGLVVTRIVPQ